MTMKNVPITIGFASITATQLAVGLCQLTLSAEGGGKARAIGSKHCSHRDCVSTADPLPQIPLDAYHLCVFYRHRALEVTNTSISILYGAPEFP